MAALKLALRTLKKTPFITAVAVLSLSLGIGANTAIFSLFDQMLLQALPVQEPGELVNLSAPGPKPGSQSCNQAGDCNTVFSYPMFRDLEATPGSLAGIAAHRLFGANLAFSGQTNSGEGVMVSGSYFPVLGIEPVLGRLLGPDDDRTVGGHYVAVLSYSYWENQLGRDPAVLNQTIVVNGQSMTIVGVTPRGFRGTTLGGQPDVFVPITMRGQMTPGFEAFENRRSYWAYVFARVKPGVTLKQADAEINTIYSAIVNEVEVPLQRGMSEQTLQRFRDKRILVEAGTRGQSSLHGEVSTPLSLLFAITGIVLLIACANIANLLLARGARRGSEMAIRGSLGASRSQLLTQLLVESVLLAGLGGLGSLLVARWTLGLISASLPAEAAATLVLELSPTVVLFTGVLALGTGVLFGMYPALHSSRPDLVTILKASAGQPSGARAAARFRSALITGQIALSMALLVAAGLFIKSLVNVSRVDLGLEADNIITFGISPQLNGYEWERSGALLVEAEQELATIPGVTAVSASMVPLLTGNSWGTDVSVEGFESGPDIDSNSRLNQVGPGYFAALGVPLLAGREFTDSDVSGTPPVSIVNEAFLRKFNLDSRDAVGRFMATNGGGQTDLDIEIVGVVQDAKYSEVKDVVPPVFFQPYRQNDQLGSITYYVRAALPPEQLFAGIRSVIGRLDSDLPVEELKTLEQQADENVFLDRIISTLSAAFAVLATLLAAVGLYGVLAYTVAQRTREIGLRMALGAGRGHVRGMVLSQIARMVAIGGALGIITAYFVGRAAQSLLYGMEGFDAAVLVVVSVLLALVAFSAGFIPALRASQVDPMDALRYE